MKKLGIIGGAGPLASALFYETLVHESYRLGTQIPEILLLNYPFHRGLTPVDTLENGAKMRQELFHCLKSLKAGGVSLGVLVCNTLHLELAKIDQEGIAFLRIPDLVLREIREQKGKRLLLLATQNTCRSSLYIQNDVTIFSPSLEKQKIVDAVIDRVLQGDLRKSDSEAIEELIRNFPIEIDGVILGCTDLPVLHHRFPIRSALKIYDSVKIPAKTILRFL